VSAEELATFGITVYFLQSNGYFDIRKSAIDGIIQRYSKYFDEFIVKSKKRYSRIILIRGVAKYIDEHEEIRELVYQNIKRTKRGKDVDWIIIAAEIVRAFNSVLSSGDISSHMHKFNTVYYKDNAQKKEQTKLYTFIDMYFGQMSTNCFEDIYINFYNSIKRGVFVYKNKSHTIIDIIDRNNNSKKSLNGLINDIIKDRRIFYFCVAARIFYDFAKPFIDSSDCAHDETQGGEIAGEQADSRWSKYPDIPKISIEWLEDPRFEADDAEYIVAKNILIYAFYHIWLVCQMGMIDKIIDFLNDIVNRYGLNSDVRQNPDLLHNILVFLYNENARKNNIIDVVINEYEALYTKISSPKNISLLFSGITRKEAIELMAASTTKYLLSLYEAQYIEPGGYAYRADSKISSHMDPIMYFCIIITHFIKKYGIIAVNAFIEWLTKPYKLKGIVFDLHKYVFVLDNEIYEPIEYLLAIYDGATDVFLSYGLHFLFEVLEKHRFLKFNVNKKSKMLTPYISVL